jgi:hypothetical protein
MSDEGYKNSAMDPDKFEGLRKLEGPEHVQVGGRTCPVLLSEIRLGNRICPNFLESLVQRSFLMICTSPTHPMHPS